VAPEELVEKSADELLEEIRSKSKLLGLTPLCVLVSAIAFVAFLVLLESPDAAFLRWGMLGIAVLGLVCLPRTMWRDRQARLVRIHYLFDDWGKLVQEGLDRLLQVLGRSSAIWSVSREHVHGDWKRHAGAGTSVARSRIRIGWGAPSFIETNARIGFLKIAGTKLYLFPDRMLIFGPGGVRSVRYADLSATAGTVSFREEQGVPSDARVTGKTWRYVNKSGGPDRRFNNNYQIPVVSYGTLEVQAPSGLRISLQTSAEHTAADAAKVVRDIQTAVSDLESQRAATLRQEPIADFTVEHPPLSLPGLGVLKPLGSLLACHWVDKLPSWGAPIAWGLLLALPPVALAAWFSSKSIATGCVLCLSLIVAGGGIGRLLYEALRLSTTARLERASAARSRFRAVLTNELRTQALEQVSFTDLVTSSDVARPDADAIADQLYRLVVGKFLAASPLSDRERSKLGALARALEIDQARSRHLEQEAKAERYRKAVSDVLSDGIVTAEEARILNDLQARLGVVDTKWAPGNVVQP
jgi:hypothetical protein